MPGCVGNLLAKKQLAITFITSRIQVTICHGILNSALVLVRMGAIREMAVVDERPQVTKETGDLLRFYVPQLELPNTWRIDDVTSLAEWKKPRIGCCVFAFLCVLTHASHTQIEPGLHGV